MIYPLSGSRTCCQGLVDLGFLMISCLLPSIDLIISGIRRLFDQSPPPITFPALQIPTLIFFKFLIYVLTSNNYNFALDAL